MKANRIKIKAWLKNTDFEFDIPCWNISKQIGGGFRSGNTAFEKTSDIYILLRKTAPNKYVIYRFSRP
jgi:hypothetical protein